jgi:phospholipase/lecithinase/hemolysin
MSSRRGWLRTPLRATLAFLIFHAAAHAADLPPIAEVVSFGDSLSDAGTYWLRFTTNPGLTFAQHLALHYGALPLPNQHMDRYEDVYRGNPGARGPGGLNYAEGGAKANSAYSTVSQNPEGKPISTARQLQHFLSQHRRFAPQQLVTFYIGTNDALYDYDPNVAPVLAGQLRENLTPSDETMRQEISRVEMAARDAARTARDMLAHGAKRLVVLKLPDLGVLPWFRTAAAQEFATTMAHAFNRRLVADLPDDPQHLLVIDTKAFIDDLVVHASTYGFTHAAHEDACGPGDKDYCFPNTLVSPDADQTYVFAAGVHLTTHANELLAKHILECIAGSPLR